MIHRGPKNKTIHLLVSPELVTTCINSSASIKNEKHQTSSPSRSKVLLKLRLGPRKNKRLEAAEYTSEYYNIANFKVNPVKRTLRAKILLISKTIQM